MINPEADQIRKETESRISLVFQTLRDEGIPFDGSTILALGLIVMGALREGMTHDEVVKWFSRLDGSYTLH